MVLPNGQFRVVFFPQDYNQSVAFYRDGLQLPIDHDWDYGSGDKGSVFIAGGGMIEVMGLPAGAQYVKPQGLGILIQVEDADRAFQMVRERNLPVTQEPTSYPWGHRVLRLVDPDGIMVSLFSEIK